MYAYIGFTNNVEQEPGFGKERGLNEPLHEAAMLMRSYVKLIVDGTLQPLLNTTIHL